LSSSDFAKAWKADFAKAWKADFAKAWKADFASHSSKDKAADVPCDFAFKSGKGRIARALKSGFA
jgi:hypothetical protein